MPLFFVNNAFIFVNGISIFLTETFVFVYGVKGASIEVLSILLPRFSTATLFKLLIAGSSFKFIFATIYELTSVIMIK